MKTKFYSIIAFLLVLSSPVFSQDEKKDYFDFDKNGHLLSFQKTFPSGACIESTDELVSSSPYYTRMTIKFADGKVFNTFYSTRDINKERVYPFFEKNPQWFDSFSAFLDGIDQLYGVGDNERLLPTIGYPITFSIDQTEQSVLINPANGIRWYYGDGSPIISLNQIWVPLGKNGDYVFCNVPREWEGLKDLSLTKLRKTFDNCVLEISLYYGVWKGEITYTDKSTYSGNFIIDKVFNNPEYWSDLDGELPSAIKYNNGVLTTADKKYKAYVNGEYSEFESIRITQTNEKKAAEEKAREEAVKKARAELTKQYGEKYVNAMLKGDLILGTPEKLFLLGMEIHAYSSITKAERFYTSGKMTLYDVYGWRIDPKKSTAFTNSALLGTLRFQNGVLVSMFE